MIEKKGRFLVKWTKVSNGTVFNTQNSQVDFCEDFQNPKCYCRQDHYNEDDDDEGQDSPTMTVDEGRRCRDSADHPLRLFDIAKQDKRYLPAGHEFLIPRPLAIAAPMVRYSKLPFRQLVRDYNVALAYTPMFVAKEFTRHPHARYTDFSTNKGDRPLIAQFAAKESVTLQRAAEMISPYVDGVDLNCGCPQSWACQEGIGAGLLSNPEAVRDMVAAVKRHLGSEFCVSTKIRIHADLRSRFGGCHGDALIVERRWSLCGRLRVRVSILLSFMDD